MKNKILYSNLRDQLFESLSDGRLSGRNRKYNKDNKIINHLKGTLASFITNGPIPIRKLVRQICYLFGQGEKYDEIKGGLIVASLTSAQDASAVASKFPILRKLASELNVYFDSFIPACAFLDDAGDESYPPENYDLQSLLALATSLIIIGVMLAITKGSCLKNKLSRKMLISIWKVGYKAAEKDIKAYEDWASNETDNEPIEIVG